MMNTRPADTRSLPVVVVGGTIGSGIVLLANQIAQRSGATDLDLPRVLGLTFMDPGRRETRLAGTTWYFLTGGILVPTLYWLCFRLVGGAGARRGLALAVVHYVASGVLLAMTDPKHPKRRHGRGRPLGPLLAGYGGLERAANLLGHLGYGALLGFIAARRS